MAVGHFMTTLATPWMPNEETQKSSRALFPALSCHPENTLTHRGKKKRVWSFKKYLSGSTPGTESQPALACPSLLSRTSIPSRSYVAPL